MKCGYVAKTSEITSLIESCYEARKENELAVLIEYVSREKIPAPDATYLDIILYSREQINLENASMNSPVRQNNLTSIILISMHLLTSLCTFRHPIRMPRGELLV